jgi:hypothetical protein
VGQFKPYLRLYNIRAVLPAQKTLVTSTTRRTPEGMASQAGGGSEDCARSVHENVNSET